MFAAGGALVLAQEKKKDLGPYCQRYFRRWADQSAHTRKKKDLGS